MNARRKLQAEAENFEAIAEQYATTNFARAAAARQCARQRREKLARGGAIAAALRDHGDQAGRSRP